MKYTFSDKILALLISGILLSPVNLKAAAVAGALEPTQILNNLELIPTDFSTGASAAIDAIIENKQLILDKIANQLVAMFIKQYQGDTIRWINTGFRGGGPAFVVNPDVYFKNIQNQAILGQLSNIQGNSNIFSNGIIGTVINGVRSSRAPISSQTQYTLGSTVQKDVCTDEKLTSMAEEAVASDLQASGSDYSDGVDTTDQIAAKKKELYSQLCSKSASNDKALQKTFNTCFAKDFNCGGWNAWLDLTTNSNNTGYGQTTNVQNLINQKAANDVATSKEKMVNGIMPDEKCTKYEAEDENSEGTCVETEIQAPAAAVADQLNIALGSTVNKLTNANGFDIQSIIGQLVVSSLSSLFNNSTNGTVRGRGINSSTVSQFAVLPDGRLQLITASGATSTVSATGTAPTDLGTANTLRTTIEQALATLQTYKMSLDKTLALFTSFGSKLDSLESCYRDLITKDPTFTNDSNITSGRSYISDKKNQMQNETIDNVSYTEVKQQGESNDKNITTLKGLIDSLNKDQSYENQAKISDTYTQLVSQGLLGAAGKTAQNESKYARLKKDVDAETANNLDPRISWCQNAGGTSGGGGGGDGSGTGGSITDDNAGVFFKTLSTTADGVVIKAMPPMGATGAYSTFIGKQGVSYAFPIPETTHGGSVALTPEGGPPLMGIDAQWEVSISKIPGDFTLSKKVAGQISFGSTTLTVYPYYAQQGGESGGMTWLNYPPPVSGAFAGYAYVPKGENWYFNLRFTNKSGGITFQRPIN